jgi:hypothetical protein
MTKIDLQITADISVEFDENSEEFKKLFAEYKEGIDPYANHRDLAIHIATMIARNGTGVFIDGVGKPKINGEIQYDLDFGTGAKIGYPSPINVIVDSCINGSVYFEVC